MEDLGFGSGSSGGGGSPITLTPSSGVSSSFDQKFGNISIGSGGRPPDWVWLALAGAALVGFIAFLRFR